MARLVSQWKFLLDATGLLGYHQYRIMDECHHHLYIGTDLERTLRGNQRVLSRLALEYGTRSQNTWGSDLLCTQEIKG